MVKYIAVNLISSVIIKLGKNSLYRNSFWLMAGSFVMAGVGFLYWLIAARLYSPAQIGLAATFLSIAALINLIGMLGFSTALIRYLPGSEFKEEQINTSFTIISLVAIVTGIIYLIGIPFWTPKLTFLTSSLPIIVIMIFFFPFNILNTVTDSVFTAYRESQWVFVSNTIQSIAKVVLLILLPTLGVWGIIGSNIFGVIIAVLLCFSLIYRRFGIHFQLMIDKKTIQEVKKYAFGNYVSGLIGGLPVFLLPIIITNRISPEQTAYFYIPNMIASLLMIIPTMTSRSYFTESAHVDQPVPIIKPLLFSYAILLPLTTTILLFGRTILNLFGHNYANAGYTYLTLISISVLISVVNYFLGTKLLVQNRLKTITLVNAFSTLIYLGFALFLTPMGIDGIGLSAIVSQVFSLLILLILK